MFSRPIDLTIRQARLGDAAKLSTFLSFRAQIHRHLDWRSALDWLGSQPYLLAEYEDDLLAAFACPLDPPEVAWIRLFTAATELSPIRVWSMFVERALEDLSGNPNLCLAALALQSWFEELLIRSNFSTNQAIVVLEWENILPPPRALLKDAIIRPMTPGDLASVTQVDQQSFEPLWQNSLESLHRAYKQSTLSTVLELKHQIIGYQISTSSSFSGHLARLAVLPAFQGQGLGYALVARLLADFGQRGVWHVSVNTQNDNLASLALYTHMGFRPNGDEFPVYLHKIG